MEKSNKMIYFLNLRDMLYPSSLHKDMCNVRCTATLSICNTLFSCAYFSLLDRYCISPPSLKMMLLL